MRVPKGARDEAYWMANGAGRAAGDILDATMPFLRRYGRALTRCQKTGDALAMRARQRARPKILTISAKGIRILLFQAIHEIWIEPPGALMSLVAARKRVAELTPGGIETLLLRAIEEFTFEEISQILSLPAVTVAFLFEKALSEVAYRRGKRVLIIEDDPLIGMDMANCVSDMGCVVTGVARTAAQAVDMAASWTPSLMIANVVLADLSTGRSATDRILFAEPGIDVVFMAKTPEELLTGLGDEPAFVIQKPYMEDQVRNAVSQAFILSRN
jgi:CheY-like chemotaxis protein